MDQRSSIHPNPKDRSSKGGKLGDSPILVFIGTGSDRHARADRSAVRNPSITDGRKATKRRT